MPKNTSKPVHTKTCPVLGDTYSHPAYGAVTISRISGTRKLFGNPFDGCHGFMRFRLMQATKNRSLYSDSHMPGAVLAEFDMSFEQFSTMLCSMNHGSGTPCTIAYLKGEQIDEIAPEDQSIQETYRQEFKENCQKTVSGLGNVIGELEESLSKPSLTKAERKDIIGKLRAAYAAIENHLPFLSEQFEETVEKIKTTAKHELVAYQTSNGLTSAPLAALEE